MLKDWPEKFPKVFEAHPQMMTYLTATEKLIRTI